MNNKYASSEVFCQGCGVSLGTGYKVQNRKWCGNQCQSKAVVAAHTAELVSYLLSGRNLSGTGANKNAIRRALGEIKGEVCEECKTPPEYCGKPLTLHVDHVDGDSGNNTLRNLRFLCPNCHSQTPNFGSKNRGKSTREWHVVAKSHLTKEKV